MSDPVNHPPHYKMGKFEVIECIEDWGLCYHLGNALKYIVRAGFKDKTKEAEDITKAIWYLKRAADFSSKRAEWPTSSYRIDPLEAVNSWDIHTTRKQAILTILRYVLSGRNIGFLDEAVDLLRKNLKELAAS